MHCRLLVAVIAAASLACGTAEPPSTSARKSALAGYVQPAVYDPALGTPSCVPGGDVGVAVVFAGCTTGTLVAGRGQMSGHPELDAPNTLGGACPDFEGGSYQVDSSIEEIRVFTEDGSNLGEGKTVRVEVDAYIGQQLPQVHLWSAASPGAPWTSRGRIAPSPAVPGFATVTFSYVLPAGTRQIVRAIVAAAPPTTACFYTSVPDTDPDDLVFAVEPAPPDVTPPTVAITSPIDGAQVQGTVLIQADAHDDRAVTRVDWLLDGALVGSTTAPPWTFSWDSRTATIGAHSLQARAYDAAWNGSESSTVSVDVVEPPDTTMPVLMVTSPETASAPFGGTVSVEGTARDDGTGVARVEVWVGTSFAPASGVRVASVDYPTPQSAVSFSLPWDTTTMADGFWPWLNVFVFDAAGNQARAGLYGITIDNIPDVAIASPADGAVVKGSTTIAATATGANGVVEVQFLVDDAVVGTSTVAPYTYDWSTKHVASGAHVITARAKDALGFVGTSAPVTVTRK